MPKQNKRRPGQGYGAFSAGLSTNLRSLSEITIERILLVCGIVLLVILGLMAHLDPVTASLLVWGGICIGLGLKVN